MDETYRLRIMLIDDDRDGVNSLARVILNLGCEVEVFNNPERAVESYSPAEYEAVLTDLSMPEMSGLDVLRAIRGRDGSAKVVLVTGCDGGDWERQAWSEGIFRILKKPLTISEVNDLLRDITTEAEAGTRNQAVKENSWATPDVLIPPDRAGNSGLL